MAENLRKLASNESLRGLQEKLESWVKEYNASSNHPGIGSCILSSDSLSLIALPTLYVTSFSPPSAANSNHSGKTNSCDQNLNNCLELIEQVAKVQGQLFGILTTTAQEGGRNDGVETIKSRLLPWLEASFTAASLGRPVDSKVPSLQDTFDRERHKEQSLRDQDLQQLNSDLNSTRNQLNQVQDESGAACPGLNGLEEEVPQLELGGDQFTSYSVVLYRADADSLAETGKALEETKKSSAISLLAAEEKINQLKKQLKSLQAQEVARHRSSAPRLQEQYKTEQKGPARQSTDQLDTEPYEVYEKQIRDLKDEIAVLSAERSSLQGRSARSQSPSPEHQSHSDNYSQSRHASPSTAVAKIRSPSPNRSKLSSVARKAALLSRFSDAYAQARLDAQCLLRRCIDNTETVQRIIYIATVEAFHVAKMAFRHFKIRVRKSMSPSYKGLNDFENAVMDYVVCHLDLYDSQSSVNDVIRAMNVNPKISFPPEVDFCLLSDFIQEICCIAFAMQSLDPPLDIAFGADGEIFNDCKYRRSYDSDFTAPLVFYHVWPALMENDCVIMKGEAVTKRGAFWNSMRSLSRCRSRSLSPVYPRSRIGLSTISRSRSPSPIRCTLPSEWTVKMDS
ncbi:Mitochondria-eating protein [Fukomys damarensis]|uniref:Mitochondria-eating protein n=1 Tax=Fukomys damarensis TaxID=885580 RepID=A0A091D7I5_FUKDA|nr:Mitochondria-eating protein [Fukomys damarensis]